MRGLLSEAELEALFSRDTRQDGDETAERMRLPFEPDEFADLASFVHEWTRRMAASLEGMMEAPCSALEPTVRLVACAAPHDLLSGGGWKVWSLARGRERVFCVLCRREDVVRLGRLCLGAPADVSAASSEDGADEPAEDAFTSILELLADNEPGGGKWSLKTVEPRGGENLFTFDGDHLLQVDTGIAVQGGGGLRLVLFMAPTLARELMEVRRGKGRAHAEPSPVPSAGGGEDAGEAASGTPAVTDGEAGGVDEGEVSSTGDGACCGRMVVVGRIENSFELKLDELTEGMVVPLDRQAGAPVELWVDGRLVALGEVGVEGGRYVFVVEKNVKAEGGEADGA